MSLKEKIQAADDRDSVLVEVPQWDVTLELRSPTVAERSALIAEMSGTGDTPDADDFVRNYVQLIIATAHDPATGERVFSAEDAEWLAGKSGTVVNDVWEAAQKISGLDVAAVDEGKDDS